MKLDFRDTGAWGWRGARADPPDLIGYTLTNVEVHRAANESISTFLKLYDCGRRGLESSDYPAHTVFEIEATDGGIAIELWGPTVRTTYEELTDETETLLADIFAVLDDEGDTEHREAALQRLQRKSAVSFDVEALYERLSTD